MKLNENFKTKTVILSVFWLLIILTFPSLSFAVGSVYFDFLHSDLFEKSAPTDSEIKLTLKREESKTFLLILRNKSIKTVSLHLYIEDAVPTNNGSLGFPMYSGKQGQSSFGMKSWSYIDKEFSIKPYKRKTVIYAVKVPGNADVGEHTSGLIVEDLTHISKPKKGQLRVAYLTRAAIPIYVKIPGKLKEILKLLELRYKKVKNQIGFFFVLENKGNVHLNPKVKITIRDNLFKRLIQNIEKKDIVVLPKQQARFTMNWNNVPVFGSFRAKVLIEYGKDKKIVRYLKITNFPRYIIAIIALLIVLLLFAIYFLIKKIILGIKSRQI